MPRIHACIAQLVPPPPGRRYLWPCGAPLDVFLDIHRARHPCRTPGDSSPSDVCIRSARVHPPIRVWPPFVHASPPLHRAYAAATRHPLRMYRRRTGPLRLAVRCAVMSALGGACPPMHLDSSRHCSAPRHGRSLALTRVVPGTHAHVLTCDPALGLSRTSCSMVRASRCVYAPTPLRSPHHLSTTGLQRDIIAVRNAWAHLQHAPDDCPFS